MWLQYGLDANDFLVSIEYVSRGKTSLHCPYCRGPLTAKKGDVLIHHFAHTEETCRSVADGKRELPTLPLYDRFNLHLSAKQFAFLAKLWAKFGVEDRWIADNNDIEDLRWLKLNKKGVLIPSSWGHIYKFSDLGKVPFGALRLKEFNAIQEPKIFRKLSLLEQQVYECFQYRLVTLPEALTDLKIYRAQIRRILSLTLYYLQVEADGQTFYKIGVTRRPIEERTVEVEAELRQHFQSVKLKVRGTWQHRGNLELYFKHRYRDFQYPIDTLTEYYRFDEPDQAKAVLVDLRRMKQNELIDLEVEVLDGHLSLVEQKIEAERQAYFVQEQERQRSHSIRNGMKRAKEMGTHVGRPVGAEETPTQFLSKSSTQGVLQVLEKGLSLRQTAAEAKVSVNTVRKIKAILSEQ